MISALMIYTQFFSRIRINKVVDYNILATGIRWITLFGLLLGTIPALVFTVVSLVLPLSLAWIAAIVTDILLTAGFHLDALADTADGLFSSRSKERMLEIMKDSRVGSNGVIALNLYFLTMYALTSHLALTWWQQIILVATLSMIGKAGLALQIIHMVYARSQTGLGHVFCQATTKDCLLAQVLPLILSVGVFGLQGLLAYSLVIVSAYFYRQFVYQKIQGHTGDTIGAFVEVAHMMYVLGLMIVW